MNYMFIFFFVRVDLIFFFFFFFQAEDGIRDRNVTGVQTCALPISSCTSAPSRRSAAATGPATAKRCPSWATCCASCRPSSEAASLSRHRRPGSRAALIWRWLSGVGSMKTLRLQRDPDGLFLWHPDYAPWIVGRRSLEANPNDRAFFDPNTGEIVWSSRDGMKDHEMDELAARHLVGQHVAVIVVLRRKVLRGLRGLLFAHRSGPGDELVADHVPGQLLRRAAVRRDDPATLLPPRLLLPGHQPLFLRSVAAKTVASR